MIIDNEEGREEVNDPNCADNQDYIVRLIGQVIAVSLETVAIVAGLPE